MVVHVCTTVFCGWFCSKGEKVKNSEIKSEREREVWEIWLLFNKYDSLGVLTHLHQNKIDSSLTARKGHLPSYVDWYFPLRADFSQTEITFCFHVPRWGWRSFHPTEVCLCHWNFWYYFCLLSSVSYERLNELLCPFPWSKFDSPQNQHDVLSNLRSTETYIHHLIPLFLIRQINHRTRSNQSNTK